MVSFARAVSLLQFQCICQLKMHAPTALHLPAIVNRAVCSSLMGYLAHRCTASIPVWQRMVTAGGSVVLAVAAAFGVGQSIGGLLAAGKGWLVMGMYAVVFVTVAGLVYRKRLDGGR